MVRTLRFVLSDQLSRRLSSFRDIYRDRDVVLMAEVQGECSYAPHHKKKIVLVLSSMRHFAEDLRAEGLNVDYRTLETTGDDGSFRSALADAVKRHQPQRIVVTEPSERRLREDMLGWESMVGVPVEIRDDDRFLSPHAQFADWAKSRKSLRMEYVYRDMRRRTGLLMDDIGEPLGGRWNFDADNRKALPAGVNPPEPARFEPDAITRDVIDLVRTRFADNFGDLEPFWFAVTRPQADAALEHFVRHALPLFGNFQDAMKQGEKTLYHSVVSLYLNVGLLDPFDVCRRVESEYRAGRAPLNAGEGFIRLVMGWREFTRGIYWLMMPEYGETNFFAAGRALPDFYWSGETDLNCLRQYVIQIREEAYAHHIPRLMVTGNFALIACLDAKELSAWFLGVYADAYEWVELPNTHGMALLADGGVLATKPYAASGKYIWRISDYCRSCRYDVKKLMGPDACPFNFLDWNFLSEHRAKLAGNPRMALIYRTLDRMPTDRVAAMKKPAERFLDRIC